MRLEESLQAECSEKLMLLLQKIKQVTTVEEFTQIITEMKWSAQSSLVFKDLSHFLNTIPTSFSLTVLPQLLQVLDMALCDILIKKTSIRNSANILLDRIVNLSIKLQNQNMHPVLQNKTALPFIEEFLLDSGQNFLKLKSNEVSAEILSRVVHTIKGNAVAFGLDAISTEAEKLEKILKQDPLNADSIALQISKVLENREKLMTELQLEAVLEKRTPVFQNLSQIKVEANSELFTYLVTDILKVEWNPELLPVSENNQTGLQGYWQTENGIVPVYSQSKNSKIGILLKNQTAVLVDSILEVDASKS